MCIKERDTNDAAIPPRWLPSLRILWLVLIFLFVLVFIAGFDPLFSELRQVCSEGECPWLTLSPEEEQILVDFGLSLDSYAAFLTGLQILIILILVPLAVLIFIRKSESWIGFLLSLTLIMLGTTSSVSAAALSRQHPNLELSLLLLDTVAALFITLLFYLFPDGRFVPRWTRNLTIILAAGVLIEQLRLNAGSSSFSLSLWLNVLWLASLLIGVIAQIYRYRRISTPTQRQQTKWIIFGLIIVFATTLIWTVPTEIFPIQPGFTRVAFNFSQIILYFLFAIFPLTVALSILRYRLWDIDLVINRTLVYGLLVGTLALLYLGSVLILQSLFGLLTSQGSPLSIVVSTLIIAGLFNPLRNRIQMGIDRRFYRQKYDASRVLSAFSATMRDEVDLDKLGDALILVINETMQPTHASYWLAERKKTSSS